MLCTRRLTDFAQVETLYRERLIKDFARNEQKPLRSMRRFWEKNAYDCYGLFDGDEILGYAFFVRQGENYLLDYFAIAQGHRDEGLGSLFLGQLAESLKTADCIVGEVEDPEKAKDPDSRAIRERRLRFYLRSGYLKTELTSVVFGADYRILEVPTKEEHSTEQLRAVYTEIYKIIFPPLIFRTQFRVS